MSKSCSLVKLKVRVGTYSNVLYSLFIHTEKHTRAFSYNLHPLLIAYSVAVIYKVATTKKKRKLRKAACMNSKRLFQVLNLLKDKLQCQNAWKNTWVFAAGILPIKLCRHKIYVILSKMWLRHLNNGFKWWHAQCITDVQAWPSWIVGMQL